MDMPEKIKATVSYNKYDSWYEFEWSPIGLDHPDSGEAEYIRSDLVASKDARIAELDELVDDLSGGMCVINGQARACSPAVEARIAELEAEVERAFREGFDSGYSNADDSYPGPYADEAWAEYQATRHPPKQEETP